MRAIFILLFLPFTVWSQSSIFIRHINVVDVLTGKIQPDQQVTIQGNLIADIRKDKGKQDISSGEQIDGSGKYLIPGLWDMHYHAQDLEMTRNAVFPLMLANGVTGIRKMWGEKEDIQLRDSINRGLITAPRMVVASPLIDGPGTPWGKGEVMINDKQRVPAIIDSLHALGYDFMKTYELLDPEVYFAIARYCQQKNIAFAGHVPVGVTVEEASQSGMRSIEHLTGISKAFSSFEDSLNRIMVKEVPEMHGFAGPHGFTALFSHNEDFAIPFDYTKAVKVCRVLVTNHTAVVPTLSIYRGYYFNRDSLNILPEMVYVSKGGHDYWYRISNKSASEKRYFDKEMKNLFFLYQQGVLILAGTDAMNPYVVHGFSLHNELEWYVEAGLPALAALQTATINPARFLNRENEMGTVSKNKLADLVILNTNPLTDIKSTRDIYAVIANGKVLDRKRLDFLLQHITDY